MQSQLSSKLRPVYRLIYDFLVGLFVFAFAYMSRAVVEVMERKFGANQSAVFNKYTAQVLDYAPYFALTVIVCSAAYGLYSKRSLRHSGLRPISSIAAIVTALLAFNFALYLIRPTEIIPRGVSTFLIVYALLFLAVPRIIKYVFLRQLNVEVRRRRKSGRPKNVLVIGGAGYVGSQLCTDLLRRGYMVRVLDLMAFGSQSLKDVITSKNIDVIEGDFRNVETLVRSMRDMDAVVHLAGIVGDPACSIDDDFTIDVNLTATSMVAEVCKTQGIDRLIFASTCSVYGQSKGEEKLGENSPLNPVSLYARTKIASENVLRQISNENFAPTILRFATLFGLSPRPRFDLAVNVLSAYAKSKGKISIFGGNQWRPFVHVRDTSKAIVAILEAPLKKVSGQVFNIGSDKNNHRILDLGEKVLAVIPGTEMVVDDQKEDERNYNVSFEKFSKTLGITLDITIEEGIQEISKAFDRGEISDFLNEVYSNVKTTQRVLDTHIYGPVEKPSVYKKSPRSLLMNINTSQKH